MAQIIYLILIVPTLYALGGLCYLFFRYSKEETEARMKSFLQYHGSLFVGRLALRVREGFSKQMVRNYGRNGWGFVPMALLNILLNPLGNVWTPLLSTVVLYFGGMVFGTSWYGLRCLRLLGLESFEAIPDSTTSEIKNVEIVVSHNKVLFGFSAVIVALSLFGGYCYLNAEIGLPWWMLLFDFGLYALFLYLLWKKLLKA